MLIDNSHSFATICCYAAGAWTGNKNQAAERVWSSVVAAAKNEFCVFRDGKVNRG